MASQGQSVKQKVSFKITSTIIWAWLSPNSLQSDAGTVETEGPYSNKP